MTYQLSYSYSIPEFFRQREFFSYLQKEQHLPIAPFSFFTRSETYKKSTQNLSLEMRLKPMGGILLKLSTSCKELASELQRRAPELSSKLEEL